MPWGLGWLMAPRIEVRPLVAEEVGLVQRHLPGGGPAKHVERLGRQEDGRVVYLIAWRGRRPVGHALVKWEGGDDEPMASSLTDCPEIEDLFVAADMRSRGIGSHLLASAEQLARERGFRQIGLGVSLQNPRARALYEARGYRESGFGVYAICGSYRDEDGVERQWAERCAYLIKPLP